MLLAGYFAMVGGQIFLRQIKFSETFRLLYTSNQQVRLFFGRQDEREESLRAP
jgi:hypothetical protein